jgi:predicted metalloendopeptidase
LQNAAVLVGLDAHSFDSVPAFEKTLQIRLDELWDMDPVNMKGSAYVRKYPALEFELFFETIGLKSWKQATIYTPGPRFLRFMNKLVKEVPLDFWKVWLKKCILVATMEYLPPPFDELHFSFFRNFLQGQKIKMPQMDLLQKILFDLCPHEFSPIFWKEAGDAALLKSSKTFGQNLLKAAKHRLASIEWFRASTRAAACEKVENMMFSFIKPDSFPVFTPPELDELELLQNVCTLGEHSTESLLALVGTRYKYWEEGIYRVNAYYYSNKNQIMIPYGTVLSPFYDKNAPLGWNYGALGSLIGHEMCHGFDLDGKEYGINGRKQNWWTRKDKSEYMKRARRLEKLFSQQKVLGQEVNGKLTLDENIADLGGVGIALEALKHEMREKKIPQEKWPQAFRHFFIGYAVSWRTKYRDEKLRYGLQVDKHAPAFLRVNLVVNQFQEWYDAFEIPQAAQLYQTPEDRIRIF